MPNTNRPEDTRCPDHIGNRGMGCQTPRAGQPAGVCPVCDLGTCSGCGDPMTPAECAESKRRAPDTLANEVYCPTCLELAAADSDGVPVAVDDVPTKAERTPTDAELLAERMGVAL